MVFLVRMTNDFSSPVRTPSYQIRPLYVQMFHLTRFADRISYRLVEAATGLTHYSNGQSGCTYLGYVVNAGGDDCVVGDPAVAGRRTANTLNGGFSTDFIPLTLNVRRGKARSPNAPLDWQVTAGAELQVHPYGGLPGALDGITAATYGHHQWSLRG
jgi:outer membrane phospholipase A